MGPKTRAQVIAELDALNFDDGEKMHSEADRILLDNIPMDVFEAYQRVMERSPFWACS